jgi:hypothetical protein
MCKTAKQRRRRSASWISSGVVAAALVSAPAAPAAERYPEARPSTRAQAVELLRSATETRLSCLSPAVQTVGAPALGQSPAARRAIDLLQRRPSFVSERTYDSPDGISVRYTTAAEAFDRIADVDSDGDGLPDLVATTLHGLRSARHLLVDSLGLPSPTSLEVLLVELGDGVDGFVVPPRAARRTRIVLDSTPAAASGARVAAIHQYAHVVAITAGAGFPAGWAEALANWTTLRLEGPQDPSTLELLNNRLQNLARGLLSDDLELAAGNALWLAFVDEFYGPAALKLTVEELAKGGATTTALDRAIRRATSDDLASAFREFHLWTMLVGARSNGQHFSFAKLLSTPDFASSADGLPALSVQADRAVATLGATQIRLQSDVRRGGLRVYFEGEFTARWEADLLLVGERGTLNRIPLVLSEENRGEHTLPLDGMREAILLIRNIGSEAGDTPHRYTYAAHVEKDFPYTLVTAEARPVRRPDGGVLVAWETASERQLVGFNVLRYRSTESMATTVNPVWIPALGDAAIPTSYRYIDLSATPGQGYVYRIQGITRDGLTSLSDPISFVPTPAPR